MFEAIAGDPVAAVYADRARKSTALPPPGDWDGVYELGSK